MDAILPHHNPMEYIFLFYDEMETPQFTELVTWLVHGEIGIQNQVLEGRQKKDLVGKTST